MENEKQRRVLKKKNEIKRSHVHWHCLKLICIKYNETLLNEYQEKNREKTYTYWIRHSELKLLCVFIFLFSVPLVLANRVRILSNQTFWITLNQSKMMVVPCSIRYKVVRYESLHNDKRNNWTEFCKRTFANTVCTKIPFSSIFDGDKS